MLRVGPNVIAFERKADRCCHLGCENEATVTVNLIDADSKRPSGNKFFCAEHAPAHT